MIGLSVGVAMLATWSIHPLFGLPVLVLFCGAPMWYFEYVRTGRNAPKWQIPNRFELRARMEDLLGLGAVWAPVLLLLQLGAPVQFVDVLELFLTWYPLLIISLAFLLVSRPTNEAKERIGDFYRWLVRMPGAKIPWNSVRAQIVKAFFLSLMLSFSFVWLTKADYFHKPSSALQAYVLIMAALYLIDTVFCTVGYISTTARLDAHIRSTDSTILGWVSALSCYPPFFPLLIVLGIAKYKYGPSWEHWIDLSGPLAYIWGAAIIILSVIYVWATVVFGVRFSNLTNRGVITHGPFRYTKHPAYISKNLSWWLILVPFFTNSGYVQALLNCCSLLFVNFIYVVRAKTEERHMLQDPAYRAYADWIAEHGLIARLVRMLRTRATTALKH